MNTEKLVSKPGEVFHHLVRREFKDIDSYFDYLEALLGGSLFPRKAMAGFKNGQKIYYKRETLLNDFEAVNFVDCFVSSHNELDKEKAILKDIFLDFDNPNDIAEAINKALKTAQKTKEWFEVAPHVQFSGSKGAHVIIPVESFEFKDTSEEKNFLSFVQKCLTPYADHQILGDVSRLIRAPLTINSKAIDKPWKGYVKVLQSWDGKYANLTKLLDLWKDQKRRNERVQLNKPLHKSYKLREEVVELIKRAEEGVHLTHNQRLAIATELINNGFPNEQIVNIFRKQEDFSENYTIYQINWLRKNSYRPFTTERLQEILKEAD